MARKDDLAISPSDRLFLDTGFVIARINRRDQYHREAKELSSAIADAKELWTTDAVLFEVAAAFSHPDHRKIALAIWDEFHGGDPRCHSCDAAGARLVQAVELFRNRSDKAWSLADCLSFILMEERQLRDALTTDHHFIQAGFRALLLDPTRSGS
jgi:predicted nucleic acid-binding protein